MTDPCPARTGLTVTTQPFETAIFGAPVWRLSLDAGVTPDAPADLVEAARRQGIALIACRLPDGDDRGRMLADAGFRRIERLLTFERDIDDAPRTAAPLAGADDAEACGAIGASVFSHDRYHADPCIPDTVADEIKRCWGLNGVRSRADAAVIARVDGAVAGFNLCRARDAAVTIDLIGVAHAHQGKGLARQMLRAARGHFAGSHARMRAGTQESNAASIALYERDGFACVAAAETYHWTP